jgi:4-hydroxy-tetrahydrodipicolinate synthase
MTEGAGAESWPQGIWAAVPTPFLPDHGLDLDGIAQNVRHFRDALGLAGIFCNGLMGEGWSLTLDERRQVLEATLAAAGGALAIGVVTTHGSVAETLELSRHAAATGADHIVLMRPAGLFSSDELGDFVRLVAQAATCKVVLFDSAAQSGGYPSGIIRQLAEEGLIRAVKCTRSADAIGALRAECGRALTICDPYEAHALANLVRYGASVLYADPEPYLYQTAQLQLVRRYFDDHRGGDFNAMIAHHAQLEPLRLVYERWVQMPLMRAVGPDATDARRADQRGAEALVPPPRLGSRPRPAAAARTHGGPGGRARRRPRCGIRQGLPCAAAVGRPVAGQYAAI